MTQNYSVVTLKNATALTKDLLYNLADEVSFKNPRTTQNGFSKTRRSDTDTPFRRLFIQLLGSSNATSVEFYVNRDPDNLIIIQNGDSRGFEITDKIFLNDATIIVRGNNTATGDLIIEARK